MITVRFPYFTAFKNHLFHNPRLACSGNGSVRTPRTEVTGDGCRVFSTKVTYDDSRAGEAHLQGGEFGAPGVSNTWGINREATTATPRGLWRWRFTASWGQGSRNRDRCAVDMT